MTRPESLRHTLTVWRKVMLGYAPSFRGRATRRELLVTIALCAAVGFLIAAFAVHTAPDPAIATPVDLQNPMGSPVMLRVMAVLHSIVGILLVGLPVIAVIARRLHDVNRHGASALIILVPYAGIFILGWYLLSPGVEFDNEFGSDLRNKG